ncbi:hypothetical protein D3C73_1425710 [compost metagenome]
MLGESQGVLGFFGHQQVYLFQPLQVIAQGQAQLQLQSDAAVGYLDLQGVAESAQQLAAADCVGQVILAAVAAVEQHQSAAVVERVGLAIVQRRGLLQAVAVAFQQLGQAGAWQPAQLLLRA